jgi:hypothetical protein
LVGHPAQQTHCQLINQPHCLFAFRTLRERALLTHSNPAQAVFNAQQPRDLPTLVQGTDREFSCAFFFPTTIALIIRSLRSPNRPSGLKKQTMSAAIEFTAIASSETALPAAPGSQPVHPSQGSVRRVSALLPMDGRGRSGGRKAS